LPGALFPCYTNARMKKAAGSNAATSAQDDIEQLEAALLARQRFIGATLNLSWRLALTVLIPLIGGIQLDKKFDSSPSYTITGFMLAVVFGCIAVWSTVKEVNEIQAEDAKEKRK
jgi:F0F1-type ATP synthase assembly protein I